MEFGPFHRGRVTKKLRYDLEAKLSDHQKKDILNFLGTNHTRT